MSYATLTVYVDVEGKLDGRVSVAADLARRFDAHLIGIASGAPISAVLGEGIVTKFDFLRAFAFTTGQMVPHYDELMKRPGGASDYRGRRASFLKVARYLMELPVLPFAEPASHPRER